MASGGSVIGIKYNGGVLLAADTLLSYGSLAKWPNIPRIKLLGSYSATCATGDYADFQEMTRQVENNIIRQRLYSDVDEFTPKEVFSYLHRHIYKKRCDFEPCLCQFVFIGSWNGELFLGGVTDVGTRWEDNCVATGYGAHMALPLLRQALENHPQGLSREEAIAVIKDCLMVLFYRECRAINKFQMAEARDNKVVIGEPFEVQTNWELEGFCFEKTAIIQ
ncbi:20S proteasome subunit beta 7 [Strigomonas culicis]|uniref:Proteasome subunit beta n=1 Tax=Strigomonas culicis TaxID=28005 RepID=S9UI40_9TRYP|nr:20S proteasome subunit beta 7 [Strigomonas culicis]EPY30482.1 20S proteasome subunit beta 7 [Strigomonas culicis]EPY36015.1 20S proteasome subunit beta 7 [Strigomonas culicis]|eukprot:EPY27567.1 20S proteasome subunit beta 7 [Strigomonas culicis]